ncbi:hypothetical protein HKX48_005942 [Thoreauomyces humboldtii]|nr:hypothetical protein HKX48_005942 [Thoreauomyces humboldtii]
MAPIDAILLYRDTIWGRDADLMDDGRRMEAESKTLVVDATDADAGWERPAGVGGLAGDVSPPSPGRSGRKVSDYLKLMIPSSMTSFLSYAFTSTSLTAPSANRPASIHNGKHQTAKRAHKFVLQTAEFYGADFSAPVGNPGIAALAAPLLDDFQFLEQEKTRAAQGSVFISALTNVANHRLGTHDEGSEEAIDGDYSNTQRGPPVPVIPVDALRPAAVPPINTQLPAENAAGHKRKWTEAIRETVPTIDYSDVFPADIGHRVGVTVFRIEALKPVLVPSSQAGLFCIADCYIVLHSTPRHATSSPNKYADNEDEEETMMNHHIYVYIGTRAEIDKRFCAAMFSTGLRNWIYASRNVERETSGDESAEFLALFGAKFNIDENVDAAADSSLFVAEEKRWPIRLYMLCGNKEIKLRLVNPTAASLKSSNVFLLDVGHEVYQWNGRDASLQQKAKCRILVARINRHERVSKAITEEFEEGDESPRFMQLLGVQREVPRSSANDLSIDSLDSTADEEDEVEADDKSSEAERARQEGAKAEEALFATVADAPVTLYRAFEELSEDTGSHVVKIGKLNRAMLVSDSAYVIDAGVELFLWIGKNAPLNLRGMATELLARVAPLQKRPKWVALHKLMDGHEVEVFKLRFSDWDTTTHEGDWEEAKLPANAVNALAPSSGIRVDVRALYAAAAPHDATTSAGIEATLEHANALLQQFSAFVYSKGRFVQLPERERGHFFTDDAYVFLCVYRLEEERERAKRVEKEQRQVRARASSSARDVPVRSPATPEPILPDDGKTDGKNGETPVGSTTDSERGDEEEECRLECVVYFWQGRLASRLAYSTFKFKTQGEMEALVRHMYGCAVRVVFLEQGKEPVALLAHMNNAVVVHRGKRGDWLARSARLQEDPTATHGAPPCMYHIRTDMRYKTTRAVEVPLQFSSLVSRDCFYVYAPSDAGSREESYMWRGRGASKDEYRKAEGMVSRILSVVANRTEPPLTPFGSDDHSSTHIPALQSAEPDSLLALLLPPSKVAELALDVRLRRRLPHVHTGTQYYYVPSPRFLRCSCAAGYFAVEEVTYWAQVDLRPDSCVILDPGAPRALWVWVGRGASDVVRKLCRKSVEVWLQRLDDGRSGGDVPTLFEKGAAWASSSSSDPSHSQQHQQHQQHQQSSQDQASRVRAETAARRAVTAGFKARSRRPLSLNADVRFPSSSSPDRASPLSPGAGSNDDEETEPEELGDVVWVLEGREPGAFTSYFCGWDARPGKGCVDVGNAFTHAAASAKKEKLEARAKAAAAKVNV